MEDGGRTVTQLPSGLVSCRKRALRSAVRGGGGPGSLLLLPGLLAEDGRTRV